MSTIKQRISNCLWFDLEAEEAALHYTSIFPNSSVSSITRFGKEGFEFHHKPEGSVMTVSFKLDGQDFLALNGGPLFKFNEAISLMVQCENQEEIDHYWYKLSEGGSEGQCGWLKDKFGLSWQIIASGWIEIMNHPNKEKVKRAMNVMYRMTKPDLAMLRNAFEGEMD